jgi:predicted small secreted protein
MGCNPTADSRVGPLSQDIARNTPDIAIIRRHERRVLETQIEIESSNDRTWRDADINDGRVIPRRIRPACGLVCIQIKNLPGRQEAGRKKLCIMFVLLGALLSLMGCNTVRGMGKDVQAVGDGVRDTTLSKLDSRNGIHTGNPAQPFPALARAHSESALQLEESAAGTP